MRNTWKARHGLINIVWNSLKTDVCISFEATLSATFKLKTRYRCFICLSKTTETSRTNLIYQTNLIRFRRRAIVEFSATYKLGLKTETLKGLFLVASSCCDRSVAWNNLGWLHSIVFLVIYRNSTLFFYHNVSWCLQSFGSNGSRIQLQFFVLWCVRGILNSKKLPRHYFQRRLCRGKYKKIFRQFPKTGRKKNHRTSWMQLL